MLQEFRIHAKEPQQSYLRWIGIKDSLYTAEMQQQAGVLCCGLDWLKVKRCFIGHIGGTKIDRASRAKGQMVDPEVGAPCLQ